MSCNSFKKGVRIVESLRKQHAEPAALASAAAGPPVLTSSQSLPIPPPPGSNCLGYAPVCVVCSPARVDPMDPMCAESPAEDSNNEEEDLDSTKAAPRIRDAPEDIVLEAPASGLAFHPSRDLVAAGDVDGDVFV